ncbi:MAG: hypothetical protein QM817_32295 [Archangium sp.]
MTRWSLVLLLSGCMGVAQDAMPPTPGVPDDAGATQQLDAGIPDAGASPDAGIPDAGPTPDAGTPFEPSDGGTFFGASRCDSAFTVCDGFEGDTFDSALWVHYPPPAGSTAFARQDSTQVARGSRALHLRSGVQVRAKQQWPWLENGFFLRVFMRWAQPIPDWHLTYIWVSAPGETFTLGSYHNQFGMNEYGPNNGDTGVASRDVLPVNRWVCVEWEVKPSAQEVHVWMDEQDVPAEPQNPFGVPNMHVTNWPPMAWRDFTLEFITAQNTDEMWMDELAISSTRIGCER